MNRNITIGILTVSMLFLLIRKSNGQQYTNYFRDTNTRIGSSLAGGIFDNDKYFYLWGKSTARSSLTSEIMRKIDTSGHEIWNTSNTTLFADGYISTAFLDSNYAYAFGYRPVYYLPSVFLFTKIDKLTGTILFKTENPNLANHAIIDIRDNGLDSVRVLCNTYYAGQIDPSLPAVFAISINKTNGVFSEPITYGLEGQVPLYIDKQDNAYYYTASDSLIKYSVTQKKVLWRNKEYLPGTYRFIHPSNLFKESNGIYLFGDRYCRKIDDNNGTTIWNGSLPSRLYEEFYPSDILVKNDTLYVAWVNPYSGADVEYGHFSKINKSTGAVYIHGTISDKGNISYDSTGFYKGYKVILDNLSNIYLMGHFYNDQTGQKTIKKFSPDGNLLSEKKLGVDSVTANPYNVIQQNAAGYVTGFLSNNKPCFLYSKLVRNGDQLSARVCFTSLSNDLTQKKEIFYDNHAYQFSSTIIDIKKYKTYSFILKKQGLNVYVEKLYSADSVVWRREITSNCFFTPSAFAVDSLGAVCIVGYAEYCSPIASEINLTSVFPINRIIFLNPAGAIVKDYQAPVINSSQLPNLLGTENGFYLVYQGGVYRLDAVNGISAANTTLTSNFVNAMFNDHSNKIFLTINDTDSIYIFSSRLSNSTNAFYYSVGKQSLTARSNSLSSPFPLGYLMHAAKSLKEKNIVYISGVTGNGGFPTIIKLNYKSNAVIWKYQSNGIGDAFKLVEDDSGYLYSLIRIVDTAKLVKLNSINGNVIWQFAKYQSDRFGRSIGLDINNADKMLVAANYNGFANYYSTNLITVNSRTGALLGTQVFEGDAGEPNFIQAVESLKDSTILIGGNLNSQADGGKNGYLIYKGKNVTAPACSTNYWLGTVDSDWENAANWSCGLVPGTSTDVIISSGVVQLHSNVGINTIKMSPGATLVISPGFNLTILH